MTKAISNFIKQNLSFLPFIASSLLAAAIDFSIFFMVYHLWHNIATAFLAGRLISGVCNYLINHKFAFRSNASFKQTAWRYALLAGFLYLAVYTSIILLHQLTHNIYISKLIAESTWFIVSYLSQRFWLFKLAKSNDSGNNL